MRLSILEGDDGYNPEILAKQIEVKVDGVEVVHCVSADQERGYVDCYNTDEHGYVKVEDGELMTRRIHGEVDIIIDGKKCV